MQQKNRPDCFEIASFYFFMVLDEDSINSIRNSCETFVDSIGLRGLIIVAPEGLNGTVGCPQGYLEKFTSYLQEHIAEGDWKFKFSYSEKPPFKRFSLKVRDEIVTSGHPELFPHPEDPSHISADQWHQMLEHEKEYFLVDVRNDYEVALGTFKGAINPGTSDFKEFPEFIDSCNIPKDKAVYICCTGGIRCEKAYLEMKEKGYDTVYQLDGGILRYLEKYPEGHFEGECFVFDDRVALDKNLLPSEKYSLCPHCGDPASDFISCGYCETKKKVCSNCQDIPERISCSKNCSYHYGRYLERLSNNQLSPEPTKRFSSARADQSVEAGKTIMFLIVLLFFVSFFPHLAHSSSNPEDVAREAISKMQDKGDPSPVVDYVDWDHMFQTLPSNNKKVMNVTNPEELKSFYKKVLESPSSEISDLLSDKIASGEIPNGEDINESKAAEVIARLHQRLKEKENQIKRKLQESEYRIEKESQEGDIAVVNISHTFESETRTDRVEMHKKDGHWYFTSLSNAFTGKK